MSPIHIVKYWPCGGGMQAVMEQHLAAGDTVIALLRRAPPAASPSPAARVQGVLQLNLKPWDSLRCASRRLRAAVNDLKPVDCLYYNAYAADWAVGAGASTSRSWLYLHSDYPHFERWLSRLLPYADAGLAVNPLLCTKAAQIINWHDSPRRRVPWHYLPLPVAAPLAALQAPRSVAPAADLRSGSVIRIGYAGRIEVEQKRLDRLPGFVAALQQLGLNFQLELLGSGSYRAQLQRRLAANPRVSFAGHLEGDAYWQRLRRWDYAIFLSDYEGLSIAMLEVVAAGAVPLYPDFHDGKDLLGEICPQALYPRGDPQAAAARLAAIAQSWSTADWLDYRARASAWLTRHSPENYLATLASVLRKAEPRPAPDAPDADNQHPNRSLLQGFLPIWIYHRWLRRLQHGARLSTSSTKR